MASEFCATCNECDEETAKVPPPPSSLHGVGLDGTPSRRQNNTWFEGNIRLVLGTLAIGNGGTDLSDMCAFLDLPQAGSFGAKPFNRIESVVGRYLRDAAEEGMREALQEEIKLTLEKEGKDYGEWVKQDKATRQQVKLTVSYDMGWQKRSSGNRYDSLSGHAFMIGALSRKIIHCVVTSKMCATCTAAENNDTVAKEHKCPKNYAGSSKAMEADAALQSYIGLFNESEGAVALGHVIADDDSSMRAQLKHPRPRGKGNLPTEMPEPDWLCDPSHRTKVVAKPFYALALQPQSECEATSVDAARIKKWYSYMIRDNCDKGLEELKRAAESVIEHLFNNHEFCDEKWCKPKRIMNKKKALPPLPSQCIPAAMAGQDDHPPPPSSPAPSAGTRDSTNPDPPPLPSIPATSVTTTTQVQPSSEYKDPALEETTENENEFVGYYRCKKKNKKLYKKFKKIYRQFTSEERLRECMHSHNTQLNEAMNTSVSRYARKGRTYCSTMSLTNRVMIAMGVANAGYFAFWLRVFQLLRLSLSPSLENHLKSKDKKKGRKRNYEARLDRKIKRARIRNEKMKKEIQKQMKDSKRGATYGAGIAIKTMNRLPSFVLEDDIKLKSKKSQKCPHLGCTGSNHKTSGSKNCRYHHCGSNKELFVGIRKYLMEKYPDQYGK